MTSMEQKKRSSHKSRSKTKKPQKRKLPKRKNAELKRSLGKKRKHEKAKRMRRLLLEIGISSGLAVLLFYSLSFWLFAIPTVEGYGMNPAFSDQDRLFVSKVAKIRRFSLIYFREPHKKNSPSFRRVIGLPGEIITYKNDELLVDGELTVEQFLKRQLYQARQEERLWTEDFSSYQIDGNKGGRIPEGKYLVLGDNRAFATDSRYYGFVDEKDVIGIVYYRLLPLHEMTKF